MIYWYILAMTVVVFLSRYLFLEPRLPLRLNHQFQRLLSYASPAVLTAILAPIVFVPEGELHISPTSPYVLAALLSCFVAWKTKNVLTTTLVGVAAFLILKHLVL
ncbi:putative branched-chain amino acid transport [Vibrio nigripulchritudo SFn27]|uniref:Putative branched-chain amino acid transport n=1 Tax=Vibrio nigripulchritudo TaxID=28173 RepID=U4K6U5_9VIBR|nr:AzlD domain-containing protein [Vibrio nigripulchritudo]CCN80952.1 putative branched-chain amino acid transport [Vibrio nigripulchritudo BLFn1]CCN89177.1 putative branched-chain amino acid transport [Vibrio nigripulchritudo SFn27]CCN96634.1 putative branched-chain amino acid transport [Vibrio nigripulchritudo ENn2]CCO39596.1 putative branched-chain amino acid transport [Vibrio nigripulchritudo SFn135]CCO55913.1 putative branched-chain amino acid transport [Vibrio nigripulchritudo Wn13]